MDARNSAALVYLTRTATAFCLTVLLARTVLGAPGSAAASADSWVRVTEHAAFSPRDTASGAVFLGKLWISGGYPGGIRDLWSSADGISWTKILDETPYDVYSQLVVYKDRLWAIGSSVWSSNDGVHWVRVSRSTPFCCRGSVVVHEGKMWQLGSGQFVWWSEDGVRWTAATRAAPFGNRISAAVTVYDGRLWLLGGGLRAPGKGYADVEKEGYPDLDMMNDVWSSRDGRRWQRIADHASWKGRMWSIAGTYAGRLWVVAGYDNDTHSNFSDTWSTTDGITWERVKSDMKFSARHQPTAFVFQQSLWITAGNSWPFMNDVWRLTATPIKASLWSEVRSHFRLSRPHVANDDSDFRCSDMERGGRMRSECFAFFDTTEVNANSRGFYGGIFDGRYVYFVPTYNGSDFSGQVTRYDTTRRFTDPGSWQVYDTTQIDSRSRGFVGAAFDGRYVYFAPFFNREPSGLVTRYDTNGPFDSSASWSVYDTTAIDKNSKGFRGAVFDGRYIYLVPFQNGIFEKGVMHGQVTRYDTRAPFTSVSSWSVYDTTAISPKSRGFIGGIFDGRYIYLVPNSTGVPNGQVTRYDKTQPFTAAGSWSVYDTTKIEPRSKGFNGGVFDGRYLYLVPFYTEDGPQGQVTRYDTTRPFTSATSWRIYDVTASDGDSKGFAGAVFDGRYVYFVPNNNGAPNGHLTRYDTRRSFTSADAWSMFDLTSLNPAAAGFRGGVFDGRYVYLVPDNNGTADGEVARVTAYPGGADLHDRLLKSGDAAEAGDNSEAPTNAIAAAGATPARAYLHSVLKLRFEKSNTVLSDVGDLVANVQAGKTYTFDFSGHVIASPIGGYQFAMGCTCSATMVSYEILAMDNGLNTVKVSSHHRILGGNDGSAGGTDIFARISGSITVLSGGRLTPQFAQEVAHGASVIAEGSRFEVHEVN